MEALVEPPQLPFEALEFPLPRKLTAQENAYLAKIMDGAETDFVAAVARFEITRGDIRELASKRQLNDNIMNFYMALAVSRIRELSRNVQFISTLFAIMFRDDGQERSWNNELDPFEYDLLALPLHTPGHWTGCGININQHVLFIGDSIGAVYPNEVQHIIDWLNAMYRRKYNQEDTREWKVKYTKAPQQNNDTDCGMFALLYCICFLMGRECTHLYSQADIPNFRRLFALHIIATGAVNPNGLGRVYPPSDLFLNVQALLQRGSGLSVQEIIGKLVAEGTITIDPEKQRRAANSLWRLLNRKTSAGFLFRVGKQRDARYYLNSYVAKMGQELEKKAPVVARYPMPLTAADYTDTERLISVLHRYGKLSLGGIRERLLADEYLTKEEYNPDDYQTLVANMYRNHKPPKLVREQPAKQKHFLYSLAEGVLPPVDLLPAQRRAGAVIEKVAGVRRVVVSSAAQKRLLRTGASKLSGQGCFLTQYVAADTLFEIDYRELPEETIGPFCFRIKRKNTLMNVTITLQTDDGAVLSPVAYANDAGPVSSQLEPLLVHTTSENPNEVGRLFWRTRSALNAGTELFCAYNFGSNFAQSHWSFSYPAVWKRPSDVNPLKYKESTPPKGTMLVKRKPRPKVVSTKRQPMSEAPVSPPKRQKITPEPAPEPEPAPKLVVTRKRKLWR